AYTIRLDRAVATALPTSPTAEPPPPVAATPPGAAPTTPPTPAGGAPALVAGAGQLLLPQAGGGGGNGLPVFDAGLPVAQPPDQPRPGPLYRPQQSGPLVQSNRGGYVSGPRSPQLRRGPGGRRRRQELHPRPADRSAHPHSNAERGTRNAE